MNKQTKEGFFETSNTLKYIEIQFNLKNFTQSFSDCVHIDANVSMSQKLLFNLKLNLQFEKMEQPVQSLNAK